MCDVRIAASDCETLADKLAKLIDKKDRSDVSCVFLLSINRLFSDIDIGNNKPTFWVTTCANKIISGSHLLQTEIIRAD